jgi:hypothetical protein
MVKTRGVRIEVLWAGTCSTLEGVWFGLLKFNRYYVVFLSYLKIIIQS